MSDMRKLLDTAKDFDYSAFVKRHCLTPDVCNPTPLHDPGGQDGCQSKEPKGDQRGRPHRTLVQRYGLQILVQRCGLRGDWAVQDGGVGEGLAHRIDSQIAVGPDRVRVRDTGEMASGCDQKKEGEQELSGCGHPKSIPGASRVVAQCQCKQRDNKGE